MQQGCDSRFDTTIKEQEVSLFNTYTKYVDCVNKLPNAQLVDADFSLKLLSMVIANALEVLNGIKKTVDNDKKYLLLSGGFKLPEVVDVLARLTSNVRQDGAIEIANFGLNSRAVRKRDILNSKKNELDEIESELGALTNKIKKSAQKPKKEDINSKGRLTQERNSLVAEIKKLQAMNKYGLIFRRKNCDGDFEYFLALVDRDHMENLSDKSKFKSAQSTGYQYMEYNCLKLKSLLQIIFESDSDNLSGVRKLERYGTVKPLFLSKEHSRELEKSKTLIAWLDENIQKIVDTIAGTTNPKITYTEYGNTDAAKNAADVWRDFERHFNRQSYSISWCHLNFEKLKTTKSVELFQIANKDHSIHPDFTSDERDRKKLNRSSGRPNLFTTYLDNVLTDEIGNHYQLLGEGVEYFKHKCGAEPSTPRRKSIDRYYVEFRVAFVPNKSESWEETNSSVKNAISQSDSPKHFIGIDRGENAIANIVVIDENNRAILKQDMSCLAIFSDITPHSAKKSYIFLTGDEPVYIATKSATDALTDKTEIKKLSDVMFTEYRDKLYKLLPPSEDKKVIPSKSSPCLDEMNIEDLKKLISKLESPEYNPASRKMYLAKTNTPIIDYVYIRRYNILLLQAKYMLGKKQVRVTDSNFEQEKIQRKEYLLHATNSIKDNYSAYFVHHVCKLAEKYNAYIVFENLNKKNGDTREINFLSGEQISGLTPKQQNQLKGVSFYVNMEQKLINKLNYLATKDAQSHSLTLKGQFTQSIDYKGVITSMTNEQINLITSPKKQEQVEALKSGLGKGKKNCYQIGCILYVDAANTSKECCNCGFSVNTALTRCERTDEGLSFSGSSNTSYKWGDTRLTERGIDESFDLNNKSDGVKLSVRPGKVVNAKLSTRDVYDPISCLACGFDGRGTGHDHLHENDNDAYQKIKLLQTCDELAAFNIAKRGGKLIKGQEEV